MMPRLCLGVDPDLHSCGLAWIDYVTGKLVGVDVCRDPEKGLKERAACVSMAASIAAYMRSEFPYHKTIYRTEYECDDSADFAAAAVEGQEVVYSAQHGAGPRPLLFLAHVSGSWLTELSRHSSRLYLPAPGDWKGSVKKHIKQARIAASVGIEVKVARPSDPYCYAVDPKSMPGGERIKKSEWSEVLDAIGLAQFAREKARKENRC